MESWIFFLRCCRLVSSEKGIKMKKAIILEIVVTETQILPCQFEGDIWRTARRSYILTPEEGCNKKRDCLVVFFSL